MKINSQDNSPPLNNYSNFIFLYKNPIRGTGYLAFRDIPTILKMYGNYHNALDFGCGAGRSSALFDYNRR